MAAYGYGAEKQTADLILFYFKVLPSSNCVKGLFDTDQVTDLSDWILHKILVLTYYREDRISAVNYLS